MGEIDVADGTEPVPQSTAHVVTDLMRGTLSDADRERWLKAYAGPNDRWTDDEILLAIGSGFA
ncbi:hypothetical protein [Cryobacterium sp. BB307]|uniref:hypothetical protein n=1 Tax=Cryobacterium sp. BB307 TaxID=2716317 RepID=UPI001444D04D|nr:hypothetical protein [Cryobacterium sp. BB307]